jgi:transposase InsO family protein
MGTGIEVLRTPIKAPRANAICERLLGSVRRECLDHLLVVSEAHLRRVLNEYVQYFTRSRPHQGINQQIPATEQRSGGTGRIRCRDVLGGIIHDYYRQAA